MSETVQDLKEKKDGFQIKANELKETRNKLHIKSKKLADERDELNSRIREMRNKIAEHKSQRDELNKRVKNAKEQRNNLNKMYSDVKKKIEHLERTKSSASGINVNELKRQLKILENEQMTQPMSPQKEKKLIEMISELYMKIKKQEELLNKDPQLKKAFEEEKIIRLKAEKQHDLVEKLAKRAQEQHEYMIKLIKQLNNLVRRTNEVQETIVMTKIEADKIHREFIEYVDTIHNLERKITELHRVEQKKRKIEKVSSVQKEAYDIFERFKRGEKLSTEDLMALQKAGLI